WKVEADAYLTQINDYIGAQCAPGTTCTAGQFNVLQYANQQARMAGADLNATLLLLQTRKTGDFFLDSKLDYIHARNTDTHEGLFGIAPWEAHVQLTQQIGHWNNGAEVQVVGAKKDVSTIQNEPQTGTYAIVNLHAAYRVEHLTIRAGIDNLFNRLYYNPQNGVYVGQGKTMSMPQVPDLSNARRQET
ncbi:MAG: TonB-dependent receptor, partial [Acidihalobacter sp.]|uniref:TonB-dependent receptor domain-containing protein n=1 Tax=Acidihalobacter sp. TaxID=1872108 RepID=UPI00307E8C5B